MTVENLSVILLGLILGYTIVSWWMSRARAADDPSNPSQTNQGGTKPLSAQADWHEILQVPASASLDEIKLAYRRRIAEYHPDKTSGLGIELRTIAEEKSKLINAAYERALRVFEEGHRKD